MTQSSHMSEETGRHRHQRAVIGQCLHVSLCYTSWYTASRLCALGTEYCSQYCTSSSDLAGFPNLETVRDKVAGIQKLCLLLGELTLICMLYVLQ